MAGEDGTGQSEGDILSEALETFDKGMGNAGAPGQTSAGGAQGSQSGGAGGMEAGEGGQQAGAGQTGTGGTAGGSRAGSSAGGATAGRGGTSGGGYRTDEERVAELDRELEGQMGTFDGMLLEERAQVIAAQETGDDAGDGEDGSGGGAGEEQEGSGAGGMGNEGDGSGAAGESGGGGNEDGRGAPPLLTRGGSGGGGGMPNARGGGGRQGEYEQVAVATPVPQDIPGADGDDVVARQLREAAMKEPDPVLREKLWNEYRRYKGLPVKE